MTILTKVMRFCESQNMLISGEHILCAVSGGADSMAMLHMLCTIARERDIMVSCAHYDHQIRGDESKRDANFVMNYCKENNIPFFLGTSDVPKYAEENKIGMEEAARILRYDFLQKTAMAQNCDKIATAHNARDNAETVVMNLCRGSALRGACGINPQRENIIRPILCLDRWQVEEYLAENDIPNVTDSTNASLDYSRNKIRHGAIECLGEYAPDFAEKILSATLTMREDEDYLYSIATRYIPDNGIMSARELANLAPPIARRVVASLVPSATRRHIDMVIELASSENAHGKLSLPRVCVTREYDKLYFGEVLSAVIEDTIINIGETINVAGRTISCEIGIYGDKKDKNSTFLCFKSDKICGKISLSSRKTGDKLCLKNRNVTKSLKKLYSEAKIPPSERESILVLRDDVGLLGVVGFGEDKRVSADVGDSVVTINITN